MIPIYNYFNIRYFTLCKYAGENQSENSEYKIKIMCFLKHTQKKGVKDYSNKKLQKINSNILLL